MTAARNPSHSPDPISGSARPTGSSASASSLHHDVHRCQVRSRPVSVPSRRVPVPSPPTVAAGSAPRQPGLPRLHRRHGTLRQLLLRGTRRRWSASLSPTSLSLSDSIMYYIRHELLIIYSECVPLDSICTLDVILVQKQRRLEYNKYHIKVGIC